MFNKKYILIGICIILIVYIGYRFYMLRKRDTIENFELPEGADYEVGKLKDENKRNKKDLRIRNMDKDVTGFPIKDYCIKSSLNSAVTGKYVSIDMVNEVLSRGCRFLDFEVFYIKEGETFSPRVAYTTDYKLTSIDTENSVLLVDIFNSIVSNAFSQDSPNNKDPLFIHLRIKSNDTNVYEAVAKNIESALAGRKFNGKVTSDTLLERLMGKVVIVIDKTIRRDYKDYSEKLYKLTNLESGSENLNMHSLANIVDHPGSSIQISDDSYTTDLEKFQMVMPNLEKYNVDVVDTIYKFGIQIFPVKFYVNGEELEDYEDIFNQNSHGIVPMGVMMYYLQKRKSQS